MDRLPKNFKLIILPEDDPELSLGLLAKQDKPVVMVRLISDQLNFETTPPQLYVPLAA